ncbi:MAG: NADH:flavin oxidoreductase [Lentisphaerae bacterium GWF2_45_14]|nr:MAG: NADH:flavin oxidoreductase [Lentisphaerae bacterium GWF2_45_14]
MEYRKMASIKSASEFSNYASSINLNIPIDEKIETGDNAPLRQTVTINGKTIGNRFCVLPMEGWDCPGGHPSDFTRRRWKNFGISGAKLIWGAEAAATRDDGMSNPGQLRISEATLSEIAEMREMLCSSHKERFETSDDLYVGLQLTHSGRFSKPHDNSKHEPVIAYRHPILDRRLGLSSDYPVLSDSQISKIRDDFIKAAVLAEKAGFDFVDVKHCHGYLGHELLSAVERPGIYGGSFENRTRFLREIIEGIKSQSPRLEIGVRISMFDFVPFKKGTDNVGIPESFDGKIYPYAFGGDGSGLGIDMTETVMLLDVLEKLGVKLICTSAGSPYYNPHIQRPAMFPPSDGYLPPEDPLAGVARQISALAELKKKKPSMIFIGAAYTYLQEWLGNVTQALVRQNMTDFASIGRMVLPYPDIVSDIIEGRPLQKNRICRTFSDCTTAPRKGIISGCYPLDNFYKKMPEYEKLKEAKKN